MRGILTETPPINMDRLLVTPPRVEGSKILGEISIKLLWLLHCFCCRYEQ